MGLRADELDISMSCVAEGVFTLCSLPITVAVVQQEVGGCSLDIRVRYCRVQWLRGRRGIRLEVGEGQHRASQGRVACRGRGA